MKIGIMGGTFNPIHNGHIEIAKAAYEQFHLDVVWFMPNGRPPHKEQDSIHVSPQKRVEMVALAIKNYPYFKVEPYEVEKMTTSYSYETMEYFQQKYKEHEFYFIIGADSLFAIETWVKPERLLAVCKILATYRDDIDTTDEMNEQIRYLNQKYSADISLFQAPLIPISSSMIRDKCEQGESIHGLVPVELEECIVKEGLYGRKNI